MCLPTSLEYSETLRLGLVAGGAGAAGAAAAGAVAFFTFGAGAGAGAGTEAGGAASTLVLRIFLAGGAGDSGPGSMVLLAAVFLT